MVATLRCGLGLNSVTVTHEWGTTTSGTPTIDTSVYRSNGKALRLETNDRIAHLDHTAQGSYFYRTYFHIPTGGSPTADGLAIFRWSNGTNFKVEIRMRNAANNRKLQLYNAEDTTQIGSDSGNISLDTWYRLEVKIDSTTLASTSVEARLYTDADPGTLAWNPSGTIDITLDPNRWQLGATSADATFVMVVDDFGINNTSGSFENTWLGPGKCTYLFTDGDSSVAWSRGGTDSGANWSQLDDAPLNDATDYVQSNTNNQVDEYTLAATPAAIASDDVINCVLVGVRFTISSSSGADPNFCLRIKSGSNVDETSNISPTETFWRTNSPTEPYNFQQFANDSNYQVPGGSTAYTKTTLDSLIVGIRETATDTHFARVSAIWVIVDHEPAGITPTTINLDAAAITAAGQATDVQPGDVSKTLDAAAITAAGQATDVQPGAVTRTLDAAAITAIGQTAILTGGTTIEIDHEENDFSDYTSTVDPDSDLTVIAGAALAGTNYGLSVVVDDTTATYGLKTIVAKASGVIRARFYIDPNSISIPLNQSFYVLVFFNNSSQGFGGVKLANASGNLRLIAYATDDAGAETTVVQDISDAEHYIEIEITRASTTTANDGTLEAWVDGGSIGSSTTLDNNARFAEFVTLRFGAALSIDASTLGTFYIDELVVNDNGVEIGALATDITISLDAALLTVAGQATDVQQGEVTKTLDAALLTAVGQATDVQPGEVSRILDTALLTAAGQATDVQPGAVTITLDTALLTAAGQTIDVQQGAVTVSLDAANLTASGPTVTVGTITTISLQVAVLTASGQTTDVQTGAVSISLDLATLTATGQTTDVQPGAVTKILDAAVITAVGQVTDVQTFTTVSLSAATITAAGQTISIQEGAVSVLLDAAALTATGQATDVLPGAVSVSLDAAGITATGLSIDTQPGAVTVSLDSALVTAVGNTVTVSNVTGLLVNLDAANTTLSAPVIDIQTGAVTVSLDAAALVAAGQVVDVQSVTSVLLDAATTTLSAPTLDIQPGAVTKTLDAAVVIAAGQTVTISILGTTTIPLDAAVVTSSGPALDVQPGAMTVSMSAGMLVSTGQVISVQTTTLILLAAAAMIASGPQADVQTGAVSVLLDTAAISIQGQVITVNVGFLGVPEVVYKNMFRGTFKGQR